jgi:hypothetical protein
VRFCGVNAKRLKGADELGADPGQPRVDDGDSTLTYCRAKRGGGAKGLPGSARLRHVATFSSRSMLAAEAAPSGS